MIEAPRIRFAPFLRAGLILSRDDIRIASRISVRAWGQVGQARCPQPMIVGNLSDIRNFRHPAPIMPLFL
jgi:hypothetical protein